MQRQPRTHDGTLLHLFALAACFLFCLPGSRAESAELLGEASDYRLLHSFTKFNDVTSAVVSFELDGPKLFHAHHLEFAFGSTVSDDDSSALLSVGPVWRFPIGESRGFVDFGFSPTAISQSRFEDPDVGGGFQFTSSISLGLKFGARDEFSLAFRAQHMSNGGLHRRNPGLDLLGVNFSFGAPASR